MIILGLNRCNLSRKNPLYNVFLANCNKQVIYEASAINRNKLKKIVNLNTIDELAVFSDQEFKIIKNLTNRNIIILTKWLNTNFGPIKNKQNIRADSFLLQARTTKFGPNSKRLEPEYQYPPFEFKLDANGEVDMNLTILFNSTRLISTGMSFLVKKLNR